MRIPSGKPLFENVSSKEYYAKAGELKKKAFDGCIYIAYPDFEEVILFSGGVPTTAAHQAKRWLTVGDELVEPAENKALAAEGRMAAYELSPGLLNVFIHKLVQNMVETELGPYMTAGLLVGYLEGEKSTCVLKLEDGSSMAYVFINFGRRVGAVFESPEGRSYDDDAIKAIGRFKEHTTVAIYFTELSQKYLNSRADAKVEARPIVAFPTKTELSALPVKPVAPPEPVSPFPVEAARPVKTTLEPGQVMAKPARIPVPLGTAGVKLVVAMSVDQNIGLAHRSRQQALEVFEEGDIAWVDGKTFSLLHLLDPNVNIILPDGREYAVTLKEAPIRPEESRYIIMPRKLRKRLAIDRGATVEVKA